METKRAYLNMTGRRLSAVAAAAALLIGGATHAKAGPELYGTAYNGPLAAASLYTIDSTTGAATLVGATGFNRVGAIDFDPLNGVLYGIGTNPLNGQTDLITIDPMTGLATAVGNTGTANTFQDISFRSDGTLFGYNSGSIYTLNIATGAAALVGSTSFVFASAGNGLAFDPSNTLYTVNDMNIQTINQTNGAATTVATANYQNPPLNFAPRVNGMDYDLATGTLWASTVNGGFGVSVATNYLTTVDVSTGNVTVIGQTVTGLDALAVAPAASVPDSMSTLWLALPFSGIVLCGRFRRA